MASISPGIVICLCRFVSCDCFAVKFRKPFITWCGNRPERARDFLRICGLESRQVVAAHPADIEKLISSPIDYDEVSDRLKSHLMYSRTFLEESLTGSLGNTLKI